MWEIYKCCSVQIYFHEHKWNTRHSNRINRIIQTRILAEHWCTFSQRGERWKQIWTSRKNFEITEPLGTKNRLNIFQKRTHNHTARWQGQICCHSMRWLVLAIHTQPMGPIGILAKLHPPLLDFSISSREFIREHTQLNNVMHKQCDWAFRSEKDPTGQLQLWQRAQLWIPPLKNPLLK